MRDLPLPPPVWFFTVCDAHSLAQQGCQGTKQASMSFVILPTSRRAHHIHPQQDVTLVRRGLRVFLSLHAQGGELDCGHVQGYKPRGYPALSSVRMASEVGRDVFEYVDIFLRETPPTGTFCMTHVRLCACAWETGMRQGFIYMWHSNSVDVKAESSRHRSGVRPLPHTLHHGPTHRATFYVRQALLLSSSQPPGGRRRSLPSPYSGGFPKRAVGRTSHAWGCRRHDGDIDAVASATVVAYANAHA